MGQVWVCNACGVEFPAYSSYHFHNCPVYVAKVMDLPRLTEEQTLKACEAAWEANR